MERILKNTIVTAIVFTCAVVGIPTFANTDDGTTSNTDSEYKKTITEETLGQPQKKDYSREELKTKRTDAVNERKEKINEQKDARQERFENRTEVLDERKEVREERTLKRTEVLEEKRKELETKKEEKKKEIEARKADLQNKVFTTQTERAQAFVQIMLRRFNATVERLESIGLRIESRIEKLKEDGIDTAESERHLEEARKQITSAEEMVVALPALSTDSDGNSETIRAQITEYRNAIEPIKRMLRGAHQSLVSAVRTLKPGQNTTTTDSDSVE